MSDANATAGATRCPHCGGEIRPDAPAALCPACLLVAALERSSDVSEDAVTMLPPTVSRPAPGDGARLVPGQEFGPYRIVRLLGRGGMGEVYEAEQQEQGRRVALKLLNDRLTNPHDRARFLREGQLAASISHPNSVYIFGSDDISGTLVIAMELLAGGTLKDRVHQQGPLPPAAAVDAILQVIAGLDAAYAGGILHRDVKPANCFIDRDGTVKIGDFGLSIPTETHDVTVLTKAGVFQGTPQFAPPERLRGVPQDVRADIYAVGATLYYLLTGQAPFDDRDLMALLTRIATDPPRSPRELVHTVPRGLAAIVLRCLAKDRAARPATYAALDEALRPFGSAAPTPATIGLRFVAGAIDQIIWSLPVLPLNMTLALRTADGYRLPWWQAFPGPALIVIYYGISEGVWGASIGKRIAGLRVTRGGGQPPGLVRAIWRAVIFQTPIVIGSLPGLVLGQSRLMELFVTSRVVWYSITLGHWILLGLLFSTARRRNGFAGVHEIATGTRVVRRAERSVRSALEAIPPPGPVAGNAEHAYGPYSVVGSLGRTEVGEMLVGFDPSLRRRVWIHTLPPGTPPVGPLVRDLSRPGRLRWLGGGRSSGEAWDAYEALDGMPLARLPDAPQPWRVVRSWLADLAREIDAGLADKSIGALTLERVWITRNGYAKLLDFRAPGLPAAALQEEAATLESAQTFLAAVTERALDRSSNDPPRAIVWHSIERLWRLLRTSGGSSPGDEPGATAARAREPLPLSASVMLDALRQHLFATSPEIVTRTTALLQDPDRVGRWRRAATIALCGLMPAGTALMILLVAPLISRALPPNVLELNTALMRLSSLSADLSEPRARERSALEVYVAAHFQPMISNPQTWANPYTVAALGPRRLLAERIMAEHPSVSADELASATAVLGPFLQAQESAQRRVNSSGVLASDAVGAFTFVLTVIALFGVLWAFILRGGLFLRVCGIAVVTRDGKPASRLRTLWRGLVAWCPAPLAAVLWLPFGVFAAVPGLREVALGLFLLGVAWAVAHPMRGVQDRLAGTWLVPI